MLDDVLPKFRLPKFRQYDVLPKFRQYAKYLQDFYLTFCTLLKILHKISKIVQKRMGQYKK